MRTLKISLSMLLAIAALIGCASSSTKSNYRPFTGAEQEYLQIGLSIGDVRAHLGPPHRMYSATFGKDTDQPWDGVVCVYFAERDPLFKTVKHFRKNRLIFAVAGSDTLLNHWELEQSSVASIPH